MSCCPSIWWCTPEGPIEVAPDGSGVYTRPAVAVGHPFKSLADALEVCPLPPDSVACGGCSSPLLVPQSVIVAVSNQTGTLALPNAIPLTKNGTGSGFSGEYQRWYPPNLADSGDDGRWVLWHPCGTGTITQARLATTVFGAVQITGFNSLGSGWVSLGAVGSTSWTVRRDFACGSQYSFPMLVGNFNFSTSGGTFLGTADLHLTV